MSKEAYCKVIDLITTDKVDFKKIALGLAKECPEVFIALHESKSETLTSMEHELLTIMNSGTRVGAIKRHREMTGLGLKESKDFCDALYARGASPSESIHLSIFEQIRESITNIADAKNAGLRRYKDGGEF
jgi:ribosomal protein L7/L12